MSNQGLSIIDNLIEKITHVEIEISTRAIKNLETKINLKTINLIVLDSNTINKLILALIDWVAKSNHHQQETIVFKAIFIAKESLKYANELIIRNLRSKNVLNFISNILNSKVNQNISDVCGEFIKVFLSKENNDHLGTDNNSYQNTFELANNNANIIKNFNNNILNNYNSDQNIYQNTTFHNNLSQEKEQNFTFNNHLNITSNNNNTANNGLSIFGSVHTNNNLQNTQNCNNTFYNHSTVQSNSKGNFIRNELNNNVEPINPNLLSQHNEFPNRTDISSDHPNIYNFKNTNSTNKKGNLCFEDEIKQKTNSKNFNNNNSNKYNNENQSKIKVEKIFNLKGVSTFPLLNVSKKEEQFIYDANINLKFGDSLHISKTLNNLYFNILTEYPIEYLLQNSEIIKSLLIIFEKSNHLEYGNILFRILHKVFDLIEKKIHLFSHNLSNTSNPLYNQTNATYIDSCQKPIFYPGFSNEYQQNNHLNYGKKNKGGIDEQKISTENCISVRNFLIICAEALIISTFSAEKLPYAIILLEKNFNFLKKLMIDSNDDEWTIIIRQLFNKLYEVILIYRSKGIDFHLLSVLLLRFVLSLSDSAFIRFSTNSNYEIVTIVKEIVFIFDDTTSNLAEKTLAKIKRILLKNSDNHKLVEVLNEFIFEYEKAEIIKASIDIAKRIVGNNVEFGDQVVEGGSKNSSCEFKFILDNFNNILLAYKYFIDTNEEIFINRVLLSLKEKENNNDFGCIPNTNSNVYSRYPSYSYANDDGNNTKNQKGIGINNVEFGNHNEFCFIKFLTKCLSYLNIDENYLNSDRNKLCNNDNISIIDLSNCFLKLISFLNSLDADSPFKYLTYLDLLSELEESENIITLINQTSEILLGIVNDLAQSVDCKNKKLETCIMEIVHEIHFKNIIQNNNILNHSEFDQKINKNSDNFFYLFEILPVYPKNMKMLSLNAKIEKTNLNLNSKILKYLRLLFSKNELIRLNTINYFKNLFNLNANLDFLEDKIIEYVEFSNSYEKLKRIDIIYSIQTAEKEYETLYNYIISNCQNIQIEFYPLLNILYSNKMDYNMKTAAIEQLIYLTFDMKFSQNFCNEIVFFCYEILVSKFNEYKNVFEKKIIFNNNEKHGDNFISDYNSLNSFVDEFYKDANLNYISALMKLINFIILNNSENDSIRNFLVIKKNEKLLNFLNGIIVLLFPSDDIENALNSDLKKPKSKHLMNVNFVYFLYLVAFNLRNSFNKIITKNVINNIEFNRRSDDMTKYVENKQNFLLESYSFIEIHKHYFFDIMPIKNYVKFSLEGLNKTFPGEKLSESNQTPVNERLNKGDYYKNKYEWDNYDIKRNIIEFINFKSFYTLRSFADKSDYEVILNNLYDEKLLKQSLIYYLNESNEPNYMEIFINTSKLFEFYLSENYRLLFSNVKSKQISGGKTHQRINENTEDKNINNMYINNSNNNYNTNNLNSLNSTIAYELINFEKKESNLLVQIFSYLKCLLPHTVEERNIIIDILNSIKIFLSFYKNFLNLKNSNKNNSNGNNYSDDNNKIDITNYERCLRELENSSNQVLLALFKKGLNDCLYNYLTFICNSKNFISEFQKNTDHQLFLVEILDLIISFEEIFDAEFFFTNSKTIMFLIKTFINLFYNSDLLSTARLLITKLAINMLNFANYNDCPSYTNYVSRESISKQTKGNSINNNNKSGNLNLNSLICENKNLLNTIIESIDFFVSNYKHEKLKNLSKKRFNKKNNFVEYNEDELGNINAYYPQDPRAIAFKDLTLLKSNLILLSRILDLTNINLIGPHKIFSNQLQNKIASKSFTLLRYFEFEFGSEIDQKSNKICDNTVFVDVIILILEILEKIKTSEGKIEIMKTNPMILSSLFDFIINNSIQNILIISIVNYINLLIEDILKNDNNYPGRQFVGSSGGDSLNLGNSLNFDQNSGKLYIENEKNKEFYENRNDKNIHYSENFTASQNLDRINPINEYAMSGSTNNYNDNNQEYNQKQKHSDTKENFIEEIIILNEKIYEITSLMNLLNLIKKNLKSSLLCASLISLVKKLIFLEKMRDESIDTPLDNDIENKQESRYQINVDDKHKIKSNFYDLISNSSFFEIQNEIFKNQLENFEFIVNFATDDFLNNFFPISAGYAKKALNVNRIAVEGYSNAYYNGIYYDKLSSKINKLHEITESLILIGTILDMFCIVFAKCSNLAGVFENNKIIILENLNNLFKLFSMLKPLKNKLNKKDILLFFEGNGFSQIFKSVTTKFFSLFHLLYFKNVKIINEEFLGIDLFFNDFYKANVNEKFNEVNEFNSNYKLQNSILNIPCRKLDVEFDDESSLNSSNKDLKNENYVYEKNNPLFNKMEIAKNNANNGNNYIKENFSCQSSKPHKFVQLCYDLLTLEEIDDLEIKVYFAKVLPYLIETIIYFNIKLSESNPDTKLEVYQNNLIDKSSVNVDKNKTHKFYQSSAANDNENSNGNFLRLKNEGDTILQLMTGLKQVYKIKYEKNDLKIKIRFDFENSDLTEKNTLIFAISSLLLVSQTAKRLFIKSNFINTFIDYIKQLSEKLLEVNLENPGREKEYEKINRSKITSDLNINNINKTNISYSRNDGKDFLDNVQNKNGTNLDYIISEYKNVLILFQNLYCDFHDCQEKESLFIPIETINQNFLNSNITNISNLNMTASRNIETNNHSIISKTSAKNTNLAPNSMNLISNSKTLTKNKIGVSYVTQNQIKKSKSITENNPNNFEFHKNSINTSGLNSSPVESQNYLAANFLKTLYEIFHDTIRYEIIHENYLKLLINVISKNDHAKKAFIISVSNPEAIGNKDSFIIILLEYLQKKFLNNNLNNTYFSNEANITSLDLFIKLLKCLFQNKQIVLFLLKIKFVENFQKDLISLITNKRFYSNKRNQICLTYLLDLFVSLSFDNEIRKKIADKDLIEIFTDAIIKIKNENVVYNILFVFRNLSFVNQNKAHFLANENLLGTIFAVLSGEFSLKVKYMISHLLWILLFNNQTLKAILNKEAFKNVLISTQLHLQKEQDIKKYLKEEEHSAKELDNYDKYLEESCLNFKKIIHILDT